MNVDRFSKPTWDGQAKLAFQAIASLLGASGRNRQCLKEAGLPETGRPNSTTAAPANDGATGHSRTHLHAKLHQQLTTRCMPARQRTADHAAAPGRQARFGGQRFGEMEVWAGSLRPASTAGTATSKRRVEGRTKIYESMVKGGTLEAGTPASFTTADERDPPALNMQLRSAASAAAARAGQRWNRRRMPGPCSSTARPRGRRTRARRPTNLNYRDRVAAGRRRCPTGGAVDLAYTCVWSR